MKWIRQSLVWASLGYLSATAFGQDVVQLGRPTPLPSVSPPSGAIRLVSGFAPIAPRPTVVRASGAAFDDEPKPLALPGGLPSLPALTPEAPAKDTIIATVGEPKKTPTAPIAANCDAPDSGIFNWSVGGMQRFYARAEYLLWWTRGMNLPPLVTTAAPTDPEATRGALGFGTTRILYGNNTTSAGPASGARFTLGYYLDNCGIWGVEANYFFLGGKGDSAAFNSGQYPVLGRPFYDINDGVQSRQLTTSPGINPGDLLKATGSIAVNTSSTLQGAELNLRPLLWCECNWSVVGLVGFRYLDLNEHLTITEHATVLQNIPVNPPNLPILAGDQVTVSDQFHTRNQFFGGQFGASYQWYRGPWFLQSGFKLGLGSTLQTVDIDGYQRIVMPNGTVQSFHSGLYAVNSNIGHFSQSRFGIVPDVNVRVGYNVTNNLRVFVGFDFLYWNSVIRPGDQIDQALDLNRVPNSGAPFPLAPQVRPIVPFRTSSFWATGVSAGLEFRF